MGAMQTAFAGAFVARPGKKLFPLVTLPDVIGSDLLAVEEQMEDGLRSSIVTYKQSEKVCLKRSWRCRAVKTGGL